MPGNIPDEIWLFRIVAFDDETKQAVNKILDKLGLNLDIYINPKGKFYY